MHTTRQIFKIDLVHDAKARRHHAEGVKGLHTPFHELIALVIALKLQLHIQIHRIFLAVKIDHDRMVHHQVNRHQRLNAFRVFAQLDSHTAHGSQVSQQGDTGKVLQNHA